MKFKAVSKKIENISLFLMLSILVVFCITMVWRGLIISLQKHGILAKKNLNGQTVMIDWNEIYPENPDNQKEYLIDLDNDLFAEDKIDNVNVENTSAWEKTKIGSSISSVEGKYISIMDQLKKKVDESTRYLPYYNNMSEISGRINKTLGKSYFDEHSDIFLLDNGQLTGVEEKYTYEAMDYEIHNMLNFAYWLEENDTEFLYVQYPYKEAAFDYLLPEGMEDYADENADYILKYLDWKEVNTLDLRDEVAGNDAYYDELFFETDHHWNLEGGRWAAGKIGNYLNEKFFDMDTSILNKDNFESKVYSNWSLGSYGRKVTLAEVKPDDFVIYYPTFETSLRVENKDIDVDITGTFEEVICDYDNLNDRDYYNNICYDALLYGNRPLTRITNNLNPDGPRILIIKDSFSLAMAPYLSLMASQVDLIDIRDNLGEFNGSIKTFVKEENPDIVIIMTDIGQYVFR